ncbi:MAG: motility protein A [Desulfovibrionaceae bacterium]
MDLATLIGITLSFGLVFLALLSGGSLSAFVDAPALMIVLGGTLGCCLTTYPLGHVLRTVSFIKKTFASSIDSIDSTIEIFMEYSKKARKEGLLSLEPFIQESQDPFAKKGLQLMIDGIEPDSIKEILETEIEALEARHQLGIDLMTAFATYAPAMGMVGTVIGLVQMLQNMSDPSNIGPAMAVALLTTFYGALLANLIFTPFSGKLKGRDKEESLLRYIQSIAIISIAKGENPNIMLEKLSCFQPPKSRNSSDTSE